MVQEGPKEEVGEIQREVELGRGIEIQPANAPRNSKVLFSSPVNSFKYAFLSSVHTASYCRSLTLSPNGPMQTYTDIIKRKNTLM